MIQPNSPYSRIDTDAERRRVLAKVYSLLIRLAEEKNNQPTPPDHVDEEETTEEPILGRTDPSTKEVSS